MNKEENTNYDPNKELDTEIITNYESSSEKEHYETNKEVEKQIKNNEEVMKEKVNYIIEDLNDINRKDEKRSKKRALWFLLVVLIEIIIVLLIIISRKKPVENMMTLRCTNNEDQVFETYTIRMTNIYYFNKNKEVTKTENEVLYSYNDKTTYDENIKNFSSENKINFKGYNKQSAKDDQNYIYKTVTTYDYPQLKNNKKVKFKDNIYTFTLPGTSEETSIIVQNYDEVLETNELMGFTCE